MKSLRKVCLHHKGYAEAEQLWEARGTTRPSMAPSRLTFYYHSQNSQGRGQLRIGTCSFQFVPKTKQPCLPIFFSFSILGRNKYMVTESSYNVSSQLLSDSFFYTINLQKMLVKVSNTVASAFNMWWQNTGPTLGDKRSVSETSNSLGSYRYF